MRDLDSASAPLSSMLRKHSAGMSITTDKPGNLYVELPRSNPGGKTGFFGAVQTNKSYVSYHLKPVYEDLSLLNGMTDALRKKMQGKSCFTFVGDDPLLFGVSERCSAAAR